MRFSLHLSLFVFFFTTVLSDEHLFRNKRQAAFFIEEVEDFVIVEPQRVTPEGSWLANDVRHRVRRSVSPSRRDELIHYKVSLLESELLLNLRPNSGILSPGFVVEWKRGGRNRNSSTIRTMAEHHCLFKGYVNGTEQSHVAISTCNGLNGLIHTGEEEYFIEPVKEHVLDATHIQPHVMYKRSALKKHTHHGTCGIMDNDWSLRGEEAERRLNEKRTNNEKTNGNSGKRRKRSVSMERHVETLVVADREMVAYYANEDIETYILTVMNMVSSLFHDASIGNAINIVLVRMMLLESEQLQQDDEELLISQHADNTLKSFCRWQKFINPTDENHPNHHDVAILLTRYNICSKANEPCSTLGLAEVAGMCQPHRSCNVNEDTGLALAYTITHEMGHNFGMSHDSPLNGCQAPIGEKQHVMSPHLNSDASPFVWSNCSRGEITKFLDRDWGSCLDDEPSDHEFSFPELPPGAMYDADHQCRLQYGADAKFCEGIEDVCQTLWCKQENKCVTRLEPAAEGTLCDRNMWCHIGECTTISERPNSIDGEWGSWSAWSDCSRSCGAGVQNSERFCNNPSPAWGGRFCIGERKRYKICNAENCPENSPSYRAVQCGRYNSIPYKEELHSWLPVSTPLTPCQLHCKPDGQFFSVMLADTVEDGTECNPGTRDICINGKCRRVACDWGIDSKALEDRCGMCHGDGTQCLTIKGEFNQKVGLGYVDVALVPKDARNIRVEEISEATNYIAVRGSDGEFYLNGQWFIQWSGEYQGAGTIFYYQRDGEKESLKIPGPIKESIRIMLLFQTENPGLMYEYTIPSKNASRKPEFHWEYSGWTICSETCGGGMQVLKARCFEKEAGRVEDSYCDPKRKPLDKTRICNKHVCPAKWWTGPWQHCSVSCGGNGVRQRTVICIRSLGSDEQIALHDEECQDTQRPKDVEPCQKQTPCKTKHSWDAGQWTDVCQGDPCNYQSRHVYCSHPTGRCEDKNKPTTRRQCGSVTCGNWVVGNWSQCSAPCGEGTRFRNVSCAGGVVCHQATEPPSSRKCNVRPCASRERPVNSSEDMEFLDDLDDDWDNWITVDDSISTDITSIRKHRPKVNINKGKVVNATKNTANLERPRFAAKDVVYHEQYEIESPVRETSYSIPQKIRTMRNDPSNIVHANEQIRPSLHKYLWKVNDWSVCSERCDGGEKRRTVICIDVITKHTVVDALCDIYTKPSTHIECSTEPCLQWFVSEWTECSARCGDGVQRRQVYCPVESMCSTHHRPPDSKICITSPCLQWMEGAWSQCSASCGGGTQVRQVRCVNVSSQVPAFGCDRQQKPNHRRSCADEDCPTATLGFSQCKDKMESSLCKSLLHMCSNYYFKIKCCSTCGKVKKVYKHRRNSMTDKKVTFKSKSSHNNHV